MADVDVDEEDINTEIVAMLAEEILRKTEFFNMYKSNVRGIKDAIAEKQMDRIARTTTMLPTLALKNDKSQLFHRVQDTKITQRSGHDVFMGKELSLKPDYD